MIQKILRSGDPVLRKPSRTVTGIDNKVLAVIKNLKDTLEVQKDPEGVGLAAPQIGKNIRVFVLNFKGTKRVVVNPEILVISKKTNSKQPPKKPAGKQKEENLLEGCLSLPNYFGPLKRENRVKIKYLNEKGVEIIEVFEDFLAQIILHEIDHLNGILFLDHLIKQKKPLYRVTGDEWEEVELI